MFLSGVVIFFGAKSAIQEIESFVVFVVSAILFSGSAIVHAINSLHEKHEGDSGVQKTVSTESSKD